MRPFIPEGYIEIPEAIRRIASAIHGNEHVWLTEAEINALKLRRGERTLRAAVGQSKPMAPQEILERARALRAKAATAASQRTEAKDWLRQRLYDGRLSFTVLTEGGYRVTVYHEAVGNGERWENIKQGRLETFTYPANNNFGHSTVKGRAIISIADLESALVLGATTTAEAANRVPVGVGAGALAEAPNERRKPGRPSTKKEIERLFSQLCREGRADLDRSTTNYDLIRSLARAERKLGPEDDLPGFGDEAIRKAIKCKITESKKSRRSKKLS